MKETTRSFLNLLFDPFEEICVSPNQFSYDSIPQERLSTGFEISGEGKNGRYVTLCDEASINLVAINPIKGQRNDDNVTAFRSFLIELDEGPLAEQKKYIEDSGLPYSICVFSGSKSLHYGVVLEKPLINIDMWRHVNEWMLNILKKADQQTKNPSRCIRFPGSMRKDWDKETKKEVVKKEQKLVEIRRRISQEELNIWLNKHPDVKPVPEVIDRKFSMNNVPDLGNMPEFFYETLENLKDGIQGNRNASWFQMAHMMVDRNFELEEIISFLEQYYNEEPDFRRREWETCIKSAYKRGTTL